MFCRGCPRRWMRSNIGLSPNGPVSFEAGVSRAENRDFVEAVLSKFGAFDALTPNPLLAMQLFCGVVMPVVNLFSWLMNALIPQRIFGQALPWLYKWRMSKMHFMYHNSLTLADFKTVFSQWLAVALIIGHLGFRLFANTRSRVRHPAGRPALDLPRSD